MFGSSAVLGRECTECIFIKAFSLSTAATERTVKLQSIKPKQRDKWRLYTLYTWGQLLIRWYWRHELYYHNSSCLDDRMQVMSCVCTCVCLTPQYLVSLNICGGSGFPVAGLDSSGTFSLIHFLLASLAAMSHSSNSILLAARKPITSCCCFLICVRVDEKRWQRGKLSVKHDSAVWGNTRASVHHAVMSLV